MLVTKRQFYNTRELKEMIAGFEALFGYKPDVYIEVYGPHGGPSSTLDLLNHEMLFFPASGYRLHKVANKFVTVAAGGKDDRCIVDPGDDRVTFHAAFYLP